MKFLIMLLFIFQSVAPATEALNNFNEDIDSGYAAYTIIKEESHQYYDIKIIQGVNDDKISFGLMFVPINPKSHTVRITMNNRQYELPKSKRGDYNVPSIKYNSDITIYVVDGNSAKQVAEINYLTPAQFMETDNLILGNDNGLKMASLRGSGANIDMMELLLFVFGGVIIIISIIIFIFYKRRKGIFSEEKRNENVFDYREFVNQFMSNQNDEAIVHNNYIIPDEDVEEVELEPQQAYERQRFYEEELEDFIDIEKILSDKGYITDYKTASEEEKNQIMLELMRMRDAKEISRTQYQEEAIKLWKK